MLHYCGPLKLDRGRTGNKSQQAWDLALTIERFKLSMQTGFNQRNTNEPFTSKHGLSTSQRPTFAIVQVLTRKTQCGRKCTSTAVSVFGPYRLHPSFCSRSGNCIRKSVLVEVTNFTQCLRQRWPEDNGEKE